MAKKGGIESIVAMMNFHTKSADVQKYGCCALWSLTVNKGMLKAWLIQVTHFETQIIKLL